VTLIQEYYDNGLDNFIRKDQDIGMNGKTIKNLSWPFDNNSSIWVT
jgi:hypothetical protein